MVSGEGRRNHPGYDPWRHDFTVDEERFIAAAVNEPEDCEEQQHLENDPASARGDVASFSPEQGNQNLITTNHHNNESLSTPAGIGDGSFVVIRREEPLLPASTPLSSSSTSVPRTASAPANSNFNSHDHHHHSNGRKRAPVKGSSSSTSTGSIQRKIDLAIEEIRFRDLLKRERGLEIRTQAGDGNCLFRAISLQVYGDPSMHAEVRKQCMDHMELDQEHFSQFVTGEPFLRYVARTRRDGVHGNNPEIQASSELFNRPIEVFTPQNGPVPLNIFHTEYKTGDVPIRLSYHDGNHYNAVIDPLAPTAGLGLGLPGLQPPGYADKMQMAKAVAESIDAKDEMELQRVMETSRSEYRHPTGNNYKSSDSHDALQRAIKESCLSAEHMNSNNALSLSDMDATYFELEQAALENSLQSSGQKEDGKKQRASTTKTTSDSGGSSSSNSSNLEPTPTARGDRKAPAVAASMPSSSSAASLPCPSKESIPAAATAAVAAPKREPESQASLPQRLLPVEDYPPSVQELVMNGFSLTDVVRAYEFVGNNFDDMLSLLVSKHS